MSVRAYKILEIRTAKSPTFNCWNDERVFELAANKEKYSENGGELSYCVEDVKTAIKEELSLPKKEQNTEYVNILRQIVKDAKDEDYIDYYCY